MIGSERRILERRIPVSWIYDSILSRDYKMNEYPGIITEWDNTPRRKHKGLVYTGASPEKFKDTLEKLGKKLPDKDGFVFLNAWNEWGEGAMIEPTVEKGDGYLKAVREVVKQCQNH